MEGVTHSRHQGSLSRDIPLSKWIRTGCLLHPGTKLQEHSESHFPELILMLQKVSLALALLHILGVGNCFWEAEVSFSSQPGSLPLQTPSADLFHYDSMNAVNWGMRGEHCWLGSQGQALLRLPRDSGWRAHDWCLTCEPLLPVL